MLVASACKQGAEEHFVKQSDGNWYRLIAFSESGKKAAKGKYILTHAAFVTQNDSVFWDSFNNLHDLFLLEADSGSKISMISCISRHDLGDSICLVMPVAKFMQEVYQTASIPYFLKNDTAVKLYLKLQQEVSDIRALPGVMALEAQEYEQIENYLGGSEQYENSRHHWGFFWLEKPDSSENPITLGTHVKVRLQGSFLSGRKFDQNPIEQEFYYGSPDQVLQGINYVIGVLGSGQTAKIILPSRLAFGEFGSSDGTVPPYTPLIYEISVETEN